MTCDDVFDVLTRGPFPSGGRGDDQVEDHLAMCGECRRLATALRPAIALFEEAISPEESRGLPGYRGRIEPVEADHQRPRAALSEQGLVEFDPYSARRMAASGPLARSPRRGDGWSSSPATGKRSRGQPSAPYHSDINPSRANLFRFAAAVLMGVAAVAGTRGLVTLRSTPTDVPPVNMAGTVGGGGEVPHAADVRWLATMALPRACTAANGNTAEGTTEARSFDGLQLASADEHSVSRLSCCTDCHTSTTSGLLSADGKAVVTRACHACHQ